MIAKGCPRCGGDLYLDEDWRERSLACLQCGARASMAGIPIANVAPTRRVPATLP